MKRWSVQDAKARFNEFLETCLRNRSQRVSKRGIDAAVLVPLEDWKRLQSSARPTLKQLLLSDEALSDLPVPDRRRLRRRQPDNAD